MAVLRSPKDAEAEVSARRAAASSEGEIAGAGWPFVPVGRRDAVPRDGVAVDLLGEAVVAEDAV